MAPHLLSLSNSQSRYSPGDDLEPDLAVVLSRKLKRRLAHYDWDGRELAARMI